VLDAGPAEHGVESTVLDPCQNPMMIYRPGAVTRAQIQAVAGPVEIFHDTAALAAKPLAAMPAPGIGLRHYAPKARLLLIEGELAELEARLTEVAEGQDGERVGVMLPAEIAPPEGTDVVFPWGRWAAPKEMARTLYAGLRALDSEDCTVILCPLPSAEGIGAAIRDRLLRAGHRRKTA
jgi:L-threonylcarbamoyladenylate synthase